MRQFKVRVCQAYVHTHAGLANKNRIIISEHTCNFRHTFTLQADPITRVYHIQRTSYISIHVQNNTNYNFHRLICTLTGQHRGNNKSTIPVHTSNTTGTWQYMYVHRTKVKSLNSSQHAISRHELFFFASGTQIKFSKPPRMLVFQG